MKPFHLLLGVLLTGAGALAAFGDRSTDSAVVEPAARTARISTAAPKTAAAPVVLRLQPRAALVGEGDDATGEGDSAFKRQDWTPPPPRPAPVPPPPPPPPPSAPPLPFTYLGKAVSNGEWEVFLARGDQTFVVRNKMMIDGAYRVDTIAPPTITFTYLPLNQVQQLNIGVLD